MCSLHICKVGSAYVFFKFADSCPAYKFHVLRSKASICVLKLNAAFGSQYVLKFKFVTKNSYLQVIDRSSISF